MSCPTCRSKEVTIRRSTGYSSSSIMECIICETVFILDEYKKAEILYIREK